MSLLRDGDGDGGTPWWTGRGGGGRGGGEPMRASLIRILPSGGGHDHVERY